MAYKSITSDEKPKLILISCLAVGVLCFGIFRIATGGGQKAHAAKTVPEETAKPSGTVLQDDISTDQLLADAVPNPGAGRDPFVADAALRSAPPSVSQPQPGTAKQLWKPLPATTAPSNGVETLAWNPRVIPPSPAPAPPINRTSNVEKPRQQPPSPDVPDLPACIVKGTLLDGENPVAILETDGERRFLHVGDALVDRFYVKSIRLDGMIVAHRTTPSLLIRLRNGKPYQPHSGPAEKSK